MYIYIYIYSSDLEGVLLTSLQASMQVNVSDVTQHSSTIKLIPQALKQKFIKHADDLEMRYMRSLVNFEFWEQEIGSLLISACYHHAAVSGYHPGTLPVNPCGSSWRVSRSTHSWYFDASGAGDTTWGETNKDRAIHQWFQHVSTSDLS